VRMEHKQTSCKPPHGRAASTASQTHSNRRAREAIIGEIEALEELQLAERVGERLQQIVVEIQLAEVLQAADALLPMRQQPHTCN
jgi:predicted DNA-binding protein